MINIDERYETLYEQWDVAGQPMGSFAMFIFAEYEKTFAEVKRLTKTLELIGKNMEYDSWMHTLIKDVIGFEKWQVKELIE